MMITTITITTVVSIIEIIRKLGENIWKTYFGIQNIKENAKSYLLNISQNIFFIFFPSINNFKSSSSYL